MRNQAIKIVVLMIGLATTVKLTCTPQEIQVGIDFVLSYKIPIIILTILGGLFARYEYLYGENN